MTRLSGKVLTPEGFVRGTLEWSDGRVEAVREDAGARADRVLLPGFVDLHVHGGGGDDVLDGPEAAARVAAFHLARGTTSLCPTTVTRPLEELREAVASLSALPDDPEAARLLGVHLEGPFLAPARRGAQPDHCAAPDTAALEELLDAGDVAVVTLAPELPGGLDLVRALARRGVRASLGHSEASYDVARSAFALGATGATHLFNAMSGLDHRRPGLAAAALEAEDAVLELILDGQHVDPALLRLALRSTRGRLCLVTDAIRAAGQEEGASELGGQEVTIACGKATLADGTLAGSLLTLDRALARAVDAGLTVEEASHLLSRNPADALGRTDLGRLAPGAAADVLELDRDLELVRVFRGGRQVAGEPRDDEPPPDLADEDAPDDGGPPDPDPAPSSFPAEGLPVDLDDDDDLVRRIGIDP